MEAENDEDAAMRAMMGFSGFDSTKVRIALSVIIWFMWNVLTGTARNVFQGKPVVGNQEGTVNVKKQRTWRQYMNRCVSIIAMLVRFVVDELCCALLFKPGRIQQVCSTNSSPVASVVNSVS
jgi:hypothetical protein